MYDALNVLSAMDIIRKDKYNIIYNHYNEHIPTDYGTGQEDSVSNGGQEEDSGDYAPQRARGPILTEELVQVKEKELLEQKRRVREKQKLLLELVKQHVAITKLKQRNIETHNELLTEDDGKVNLDKSMAYSNQKL